MKLELKRNLTHIKNEIDFASEGAEVNKKQLRDILDVTEGYLREILNSKGKYDHNTLKADASIKSVKAVQIQNILGKSKANSKLHREHALPMDLVIPQLMKMIGASLEELAQFLLDNLLSVLITKEEMVLLDHGTNNLKKTMPTDWDGQDRLARFKARNIELV